MSPGPRHPAVVRRGTARRARLAKTRAKLRATLEGSTNASPQRHKPTHTVNLTPLEATLTRFAATIASKGLTKLLSPLNATLTKYQGVPVDISRHISIHFVGAQHAAPLPSRPPMIPPSSPVTSHQSRVTNP